MDAGAKTPVSPPDEIPFRIMEHDNAAGRSRRQRRPGATGILGHPASYHLTVVEAQTMLENVRDSDVTVWYPVEPFNMHRSSISEIMMLQKSMTDGENA